MGAAAVPFLLKTVLWTAISYGVSELLREDYRGEKQMEPGVKANTMSTQQPLPICYGTNRVGGNDVYRFVGGTDNKHLWVVQSLSEGECDSIIDDGESPAGYYVYFGDELIADFGSNATFYFHGGADDQTYDTYLKAADSTWTDNMRNTCYVVYHLEYDADLYSNLPKRTVVLKGRKLYDFRDTSTAYSENAVLALYDWMTSNRYGMGISSSAIDTTSWTSAANYYDTKGWSFNMVVKREDAAIDVLEKILRHFRGGLNWYDGKFYLRYQDYNYESISGAINDYHILQDNNGKAAINIGEDSTFAVPNGVRVKWVDPDRDYVEDDIIIGDETGMIQEVDLTGCQDREIASNLGVYHLERAKLSRYISGTFADECQQYEPYDLLTLTSTALSLSNQLVRVRTANIRPDGLVDMVLAYDSPALYNDDYDLDVEGEYTCTLPSRNDEPPSVTNVSISETTYDFRNLTKTKVSITFDEPDDYAWFDHVKVYISFDDTNWFHMFNVTSDFEIDPIREGISFYLRLKTVSIWNVGQADANDYKLYYTVAGLSAVPTSLSSLTAVVHHLTINLRAEGFDPTDTPWIEFRLGATWSSSVLLERRSYANLSLSGVVPGTHTFWANTLSNNGLYGDTPVSATAEQIPYTPIEGWVQQDFDTCTYTSGTFDNTERITTGPYTDYLMCSHSSADLVGSYISPEYDYGSSTRLMVYVPLAVAIIGTGTDWDDKIPAGVLWSEVSADTKTWYEIFELNDAPNIRVRIYYGDVSGSLTTYIDHAEIYSGVVEAQYYQVRIDITDPSSEVYAYVGPWAIRYLEYVDAT